MELLLDLATTLEIARRTTQPSNHSLAAMWKLGARGLIAMQLAARSALVESSVMHLAQLTFLLRKLNPAAMLDLGLNGEQRKSVGAFINGM